MSREKSSSESDISTIYRSRMCPLDETNINESEESIGNILYADNNLFQSVLNEVITVHNFIDNKDVHIDVQYISAIKRNDIEYLSKLLVAFPNLVKSVDITAKNGLHIAVIENHFDVVEFLLHFHFPINACDDIGKTALHFCNNYLIMELLCQFNPSIDCPDSFGFTPLHIGTQLFTLY